ncbi:hypothetical protein PW5551_07605 [Petrotoga sp. 9PW.55.5.1]|uniref:GIY-YIG nuclease family protein n=1 Tax=Petrotoga sp. 9PW.55.5.1 TaxID=1308979 RepID=UPI000DC4AE1D|nr:DUF123 domain-containing protein [Petrotoga sp. 9PW.55.5.1]RAO98780.1 hypothetical protein PW5551_07605 [Petrotoga sp. 9PW.55.5.1]
MNTGSYILLIKVKDDFEIDIRHRKVLIKEGLYAYIGSAMKNLHQRVGRHLTFKEKQNKQHWHIDKILEKEESQIIFVSMVPSLNRLEERISKKFSLSFDYIENFGSTDLRVKSNFYIIDDIDAFFQIIKTIVVKAQF